jgi:hypothetical protein
VRVREVPNKFPRVRPAGLGLQALDTTEGVLGLLPVLLSPAKTTQGPLALRSTPLQPLNRKVHADPGQRIGRTRIPTRACLRVTTRTSEVDT